jgi:glucans biosynthesis protein C
MEAISQRQHYIDWIRVIAFMILIFFHCSMPFVSFGWEIKNTEHSLFLDRLIIWLHQWRLPLLFFVSGVGVNYSLKSRSVGGFFAERIVRLFIPLLFAMFFLTPVQVFYEWLQEGKITMSYWDFYPSVFEMVPYPEGTLTWSHMWFVVYLFVFTILLLPVFAVFKIKAVQQLKTKVHSLFKVPIVHLLLIAPFVYYYYVLYLRWPEQGSLLDDWFVFNSSITFYFLGFFLGDVPTFWETCERYRKLFLVIAVTCVLILYIKFYWAVELPKQQDLDLYIYGLVDALQIWTIILSAIGFARKYLNFSNRYLTYLTSAVYPFYILHQTIIVATGYYVTQWSLPIGVKLVILICLCFSLILGIYHFLIRPFIVPRVLFGLKPKEKRKVIPLRFAVEDQAV